VLLGGREALAAIANATAFRAGPPSVAEATHAPAQLAAPARLTGDPAGWDEFEVRATMASYGIPVAAEALTRSADEAGAAAGRIGFPVALKVVATNLAHKSDHGGVRLGLTDSVAVASAYRELAQAAEGLDGVEFRGVAVQAMVPSGTELILGTRSDAVFGRALVLGWGGLWTESFPSPQVTPIPVSAASAGTVIEGLFGAALPRARRISDLESLHATILAFSAFVSDLPETVDIVEINPLILTIGRPGRVTAIDATVRGVVDMEPAPAQRVAATP
jgi:succinyl-CoA synthetase beta subunit